MGSEVADRPTPQDVQRLRKQWNALLSRWDAELSTKLTADELSALYACLPDCFESFSRIYYDILPALEQMPAGDAATAHDHLHDIGSPAGQLEHVRSHIAAAEKGFEVLLKLLGESAGR